jgi:hypothetical protein
LVAARLRTCQVSSALKVCEKTQAGEGFGLSFQS